MNIKHFINKHRLEVFVVFFLIVFAALYFSNGTHAQPFAPAETLNPPCAPGAPNCTVPPIFEVDSSVVPSVVRRPTTADYTNEDFVFGSSQLDDVVGTSDDARFFFDKSKGAFRAGRAVTLDRDGFSYFDDSNVGQNSFAFGEDARASGISSIALGFNTFASGDFSTSMGSNTNAAGDNSTALGVGTAADFFSEIVVGSYNVRLTGPPGSATSWFSDTPIFVIGNGESSGSESNAITVLKNGNVGIGTVSPSSTLQVGDASTPLNSTFYVNDTTSFSVYGNNNATELLKVQDSGVATSIMRGSWRIEQTGELPKLQIGGSGYGGGRLYVTKNSGSDAFVVGASVDTSYFLTDVGIGTTIPASKLEVSGGDIRVTGGSFIDDGTTLNVPDYVFEDDYQLTPLNKVKEFIQKFKHMKGFPDQNDKKGWAQLSMQDRDMKLLEKIEELTLYVIELKEENDALRLRVKKLENQ